MRAVWAGLVGVILAVSGASAVEGEYVGKGSEPAGYNWMLHAKITPAPSGRYKVVVTSTNATCASQTEGIGTLRGKVLTVGGSCPLTIRFDERLAQIVEGEGCIDHGATCTYSGLLRRKKDALSVPKLSR